MKKLLMVVLLGASVPAIAQSPVRVQGHVRSNGTYVPSHMRTAPNSTVNDNWTTRPNVNPYNGRVGTRSPSYGGNTGSTYKPYRPR